MWNVDFHEAISMFMVNENKFQIMDPFDIVEVKYKLGSRDVTAANIFCSAMCDGKQNAHFPFWAPISKIFYQSMNWMHQRT